MSKARSIDVGDVVRLKSGGPRMTVTMLAKGLAFCQWFDSNDVDCMSFPPAALERVLDEE